MPSKKRGRTHRAVARRRKARATHHIRTLAVDIGASGIKAIVLDERGRPLTVRSRRKTPADTKPAAILSVIRQLANKHGSFDRVSVGFPGVVRNGITETAPN